MQSMVYGIEILFAPLYVCDTGGLSRNGKTHNQRNNQTYYQTHLAPSLLVFQTEYHGSFRVSTPSRGSDRVRSTGQCQFSNLRFKNIATLRGDIFTGFSLGERGICLQGVI